MSDEKPIGRPTKFNTRMCPQVRKLALLGATDEQIADFLEISVSTLNEWKINHPHFFGALKKGRERADGAVAKSLYRRALGYKHKAVKIFADPKSGAEKIVEYTEHFAPDTTACIFWLKNRRPDLWRDRVEHTGKDGGALKVEVSDSDLAREVAFLLTSAVKQQDTAH